MRRSNSTMRAHVPIKLIHHPHASGRLLVPICLSIQDPNGKLNISAAENLE